MDKLENKMSIFTPEEFHDEEELIAKTAELFIKQDVAPKISAIEQHQYEVTRQLFQKAGDLGLLAIEIPEDYGGLELNKKISGLVAERMGYGGSFSVSYNIHAGVGTLPYVYFGNASQKLKYLPKLASGEWIGAYALTEPDAGSDALHPKTNGILNEDGTAWVLNGEKQWITNAQLADIFVVFAKTNEGMTAFIVERTLTGVSIGQEEEKMGIKGSSTATLILEDVVVPMDNVLGEVGKGHKVAMNILNMARLKLAFSNIGTSKQALQLAVNYGKERQQFQKPIVDFTMIQEKIANMAILIYGAESAAYRTAGEMDDVIELESTESIVQKIADFAMECAINKINCSEALGKIVDEAVQIHGGYGYMQDYEVERLYRDARISRIFEGTNEINRLTIAKILYKKYTQTASTESYSGGCQPADDNHRYIQLSKHLMQMAMTVISAAQINLEQEQEYMRLLANIAKDIYIMESSLLRTEKAAHEKMKNLMTDILCQEGYRKIEKRTIDIIAAAETTEQIRKTWLDDIQHLNIPLHQNLFMKKRAIARSIINNPKSIS
ncbi:acyl-CoA dehydrogenase family protein [Lysinibacillus sp. Ag94]|uniref:acyl-CoA dehydrogenase family protein n=1 Tax=Lysinibacillus sp. Ag94 TaxID=2936682 RepID=UPI00200F0DF9|nr:acyl-CoA dehydrogenase family protein [Lysinibacillus sp. Ag94]UPW81291.1 acyl-CoA dehydrogenase family protein [Lysinibacillus sp. Ag94]